MGYYTVFAFIVFFVVVVYFYIQNKKRTYFMCKYKSKEYLRESSITTATIQQLYWDGYGGYTMECILDEENVPIELPVEKKLLGRIEEKGVGEKIFVVRTITSNDEVAIQIAPISMIKGQRKVITKEVTPKVLTGKKDIYMIERLTWIIYIAGVILMILAFLSAVEIPFISMVFSFISAYITTNYAPFKRWTQLENAGIIRMLPQNNIQYHKKDNKPKNNQSENFNEMSDIEKEMYFIKNRITTKNIPETQENTEPEIETEGNTENFSDISIVEKNIEKNDNSAIIEVISEDNMSVCVNCGCVLPPDAAFCCYCGYDLKKKENSDAVVQAEIGLFGNISNVISSTESIYTNSKQLNKLLEKMDKNENKQNSLKSLGEMEDVSQNTVEPKNNEEEKGKSTNDVKSQKEQSNSHNNNQSENIQNKKDVEMEDSAFIGLLNDSKEKHQNNKQNKKQNPNRTQRKNLKKINDVSANDSDKKNKKNNKKINIDFERNADNSVKKLMDSETRECVDDKTKAQNKNISKKHLDKEDSGKSNSFMNTGGIDELLSSIE